MKRTRSQDKVVYATGLHENTRRGCSTGATTHYSTYSNLNKVANAKIASIDDELLPKSDFRTRYCNHRKMHYWAGPNHFSYSDLVSPGYYATETNVVFDPSFCPWAHRLLANDLSWFTDPDYGDFEAFNARAWTAMKPSLEGDVSLTNFLLELGDFKDVFNLFRHTSDITQKISEGHLTWNFAVKPLISDLSELWKIFHDWESRLKDFRNRAEKPQRRYYSEKVDLSDGEPSWEWNHPSYRYYYKRYWPKYLKLVRTATMTYSYNIEETQSLLAKLKALRDILGLKLTPSVIWEAIPFSFLVDYVVNVGQFLKSRENDLIEPDVTVTDYSVSCKVVFKEWYQAKLPEPVCHVGFQDPIDWVTSSGRWYLRKRCLPNTEGIPLTLSLPSSNQLALAGSLINVARS